MRKPHRVAMVTFSGAQILDVVALLEVFSRASRFLTDEGRRGPPRYEVEILARKPGPVVMSSGLAVIAARSYRALSRGIDTLFVGGGIGVDDALADRALHRIGLDAQHTDDGRHDARAPRRATARRSGAAAPRAERRRRRRGRRAVRLRLARVAAARVRAHRAREPERLSRALRLSGAA